MSDHDNIENRCDHDRPDRPSLEDVFEQGRLEVLRRATEEAAELARAHYEIEPGLRAIYRLDGPDPNGLRIKLLEVNEQTVPSGIVPVGFPPHPASGLHFASIVIEVTPQEYEAIKRKELNLPAGWLVGEVYERPTVADHSGDAP